MSISISTRVRLPVILPGDEIVDSEIISFEGLASESVAIIFPGLGAVADTPLLRIHSECLTGDAFGSALCDCGPQLREAKQRLSREGGILVYLRQEGRGIGLYNKLKAYKLQQEMELDTFSANRHLGFANDLRNYDEAAAMLKALGVSTCRLLTNNPDKVSALEEAGIKVTERVSTGYFGNKHNSHYLETKKSHGHFLG